MVWIHTKGMTIKRHASYGCRWQNREVFIQWRLGVMYDLGRGVPQDDQEAVKV